MFKKIIFLSAVLLSAISTQAHSDILVADGVWHSFDVDQLTANSGNLEWIDLDGNILTFDFTLTEPAYLNVVDAGFAGDRFTVYDGSILSYLSFGNAFTELGQTSTAVNSYPNTAVLDFDQAMATSAYSQGKFLLAPGMHSIFGLLSTSALNDTGVALNATVGAVSLTAVPLPAAVWLYLTGTGALGWLSRRHLTAVRG
ncbi:MAG: VPLPA-CTERM sorting domain-containing protein [Methylococcales bacterium]